MIKTMSNINTLINENFYYCRDAECAEYLIIHKKIKFLCTGLNTVSKKQFYLFQRTSELTEALNEFYEKNR